MTADLREPETAAIPESRDARSDRAAADIGALPFVKDRGDGTGRDFWAVEPGADWQADYAKGRAYAALALCVMADHNEPLLGWVGDAMRRTGREEDGIASGFLNAMGRQAIAGETLRRVAAAYAPDCASAPDGPLPLSPEATDPLPGMVGEWRAVAAEVNGDALSGLAAEVKAAQLLSLAATLQAMRPRSLAGAAALLRFAQEAEAIEDHTPEGCDIIGAVVDLIEAQARPPAC